MAIGTHRPSDSGQGPAITAPDTEDGLYPDTNGDLAHRSDGDTDPLPGTTEPKTSSPEATESEPNQATNSPDKRDSGLDDEGRPTGNHD